MSDLSGRSRGVVISVSSWRGRRNEVSHEPFDASRGTQLDCVRDFFLGQGHVPRAHVDGNPVRLVLHSKDLVPRNRDYLATLLFLKQELDGARHHAQLDEEEARTYRISLSRRGKRTEACLARIIFSLGGPQQ